MKKPSSSVPPIDVMELLLDAICVVDVQGRFVSINGACERIFGYLPEEMIGKPMIDFVFEEDRARTLEAAQRIQDGYLQHHFENRYLRKNGETVNILWSARWSENDQVRVAVARDVSERTLAVAKARCWRLSSSPPRLIPPALPPILLSAQDYTVLLALAASDEAVTREVIVRALGGDFRSYDQRRLDTQMRRLRRKVEAACPGLKLPVATLRGLGYRFYEKIEICR
ncbi:MAG: PAS domain S-box protein [Gammaproteobacteria bacterium]|nr:PAS domain S-box protein [Gammaproteobacteria bacterium]MBU0877922.1 PAS domain S-box protein [Alphaproteobacteria bacterium]MBU1858548.1 PAS domain S-box protein [Gammaproteobacteria bacterium]